MRMRILLALLATAAVAPGVALAQDIEGGAARGAAAGGQVLGPVGAAVGGVVGGAIGIIEPPPPPVITYVEREDIPSVTVERDVVVGEPLPETVVIHRVPHHERYAYAVVNHERVIVEPHTRKVIKIIKED
ncbi:MAG TPA: DUF1236 domain-containing protein [Pseudolabrys sp.]|nr:DUF1236 domain-containing protein [Pseudolabrys sp.]